MAVTIDLTDANSDGVGVDIAAYFADFNQSFDMTGWGHFSGNPFDFSGNNYAGTNGSGLLPFISDSAQSFVVDSGSAGDVNYSLGTHQLSGSVDGVSFGHGLNYSSSSDSFSHTTTDIGITGLGITGSGAGNPVHDLVYGLMKNNTSALEAQLSANDLVINGSDGADSIQGYAGDDTLTGNGGDDIFVFATGSGNDTITDLTVGDKIDVYDAWNGVTEFADLIIDYASDVGNAIISIAGATDTITVEGYSSGLDDGFFV
ncbi:heme acquisition protein HasA [Polycladidibacter hongkongensis]|uniref:heme acquisition protein HasA n=1 Tax=Polycladidibacter hongkongensis TaxID=1647556 RepID=UPI0008322A03|nr:heme acquisition protein HasA [Pseudovibrio hongkongensis]